MLDLGGIQANITVNDGQARVSLQQFGQLSDNVSNRFNQNVTGMGNSMQTFNTMVNLYMVKAVANFAGSFVGIGANFEEEMSNVEAILNGTNEEMQALTDTTRELAAATKYTATQTAEAAGLIAQAGKDAYETIALLPDVLNLASAGAMEVSSAANYLVSSEAALSLTQSELNHLVDEFAQTANATNSDVAQLGEGFTTVGATASVLAGGITEINTVLGILANANIKGAEGGTKLRNMIVSLTAPTDKAADALNSLGVSVADSQGNMKELYDILQDIKKATSDMGDVDRMSVLAEIFNGRDLAAVQSIMNTLPDEYNALYNEIENCAGAAQKMADTKMDNLNGDIQILQSNLQETALQFGDIIQDGLRNAIQVISEIVIEFNELDSGVKEGIVSVVGIVAAFGGLAIVNTVVSKIGQAFQNAISPITTYRTLQQNLVTNNAALIASEEALFLAKEKLNVSTASLLNNKAKLVVANQLEESADKRATIAILEKNMALDKEAIAEAKATIATETSTQVQLKDTIATEASTKALMAKQAISLGVTTAISGLVLGIGYLITKTAEANKEMKEMNEKMVDFISFGSQMTTMTSEQVAELERETNTLVSLKKQLDEYQSQSAINFTNEDWDNIDRLNAEIEEVCGSYELLCAQIEANNTHLANARRAQEELAQATNETQKALINERLAYEQEVNEISSLTNKMLELATAEEQTKETRNLNNQLAEQLISILGDEVAAYNEEIQQYEINEAYISRMIASRQTLIDKTQDKIEQVKDEVNAQQEVTKSIYEQIEADGLLSNTSLKSIQSIGQEVVAVMTMAEKRELLSTITGQSAEDIMRFSDAEVETQISNCDSAQLAYYAVASAKGDQAASIIANSKSNIEASKAECETVIENCKKEIQALQAASGAIKSSLAIFKMQNQEFMDETKANATNPFNANNFVDQAKMRNLSAQYTELEKQNKLYDDQIAKAQEQENTYREALAVLNGMSAAASEIAKSGKDSTKAEKEKKDVLDEAKKSYEELRDIGKLTLNEQAAMLIDFKRRYTDTTEHIIELNSYAQSEFKRIIQERGELGELDANQQVQWYEYVYDNFCKSESDKLEWTKTISDQIVDNAKSTYEEMETFSEEDANIRISYLESVAEKYSKYGEVVSTCNEGIIDILKQTSEDIEDLDDDTLQSRIEFLNKYLSKYQGNKNAISSIEKSLTALIKQQDAQRLDNLDKTTQDMVDKWNEVKDIESEIYNQMKQAYEDSLDAQLSSLESNSEAKIKLYNDELDDVKASINAQYDAVVSGYQAQIDAIKALQDERSTHEKEVSLKTAIDNAATQEEYEAAVAEYQKWQYEQNEQAKIESLQYQIDAAESARDSELSAAESKYNDLIALEESYTEKRKASIEEQREAFSISEEELTAKAIEEYERRQVEEKARLEEISKYMEEVFKNDLILTNQGISDALISMADSTSEDILNYIGTWETKLEQVKDELDSLGSSSSYSSGNSYSGSHSQGLDYVPYDDYMAKLHRGERVLTEVENKRYEAQRTTPQVKVIQEKFDDNGIRSELQLLKNEIKKVIKDIPRQQAINANKKGVR